VAKFREFCSYSSDGCSIGGRSGGYCAPDSFSDGCSYIESYANADCENSASQSTIAAEIHEIGSKCFMSSLYPSGALGSNRPMCFKRTCTKVANKWNLDIHVGQETVHCEKAGSYAVAGYFGSVQCPEPNKYCNGDGKPYCRRGCMGKGTCSDATCKCAAGWGLYDCSRRVASHLENGEQKEYNYDNIPTELAGDYIPSD